MRDYREERGARELRPDFDARILEPLNAALQVVPELHLLLHQSGDVAIAGPLGDSNGRNPGELACIAKLNEFPLECQAILQNLLEKRVGFPPDHADKVDLASDTVAAGGSEFTG